MSTMAPAPVIDVAACCAPLTRNTLSQPQADHLARALKAIAHPARLRLISIIAASNGQEACVCDLTEALDIGQPTVSHHLKVLTDAGFVTRSKRANWVYYALVPGSLGALARLLTDA